MTQYVCEAEPGEAEPGAPAHLELLFEHIGGQRARAEDTSRIVRIHDDAQVLRDRLVRGGPRLHQAGEIREVVRHPKLICNGAPPHGDRPRRTRGHRQKYDGMTGCRRAETVARGGSNDRASSTPEYSFYVPVRGSAG